MSSEAIDSPVAVSEGQDQSENNVAATATWEEQGWNEQSEEMTASHIQHSDQHQEEPTNSVDPAPNSASSGESPSDDDDEDAGEYDPESITFTTASASAPAPSLAVEPEPEPEPEPESGLESKQEAEQSRELPRPSKKPKTAGGFLVGSSDDEDEDDAPTPPAPDNAPDATTITTLKPAPTPAQAQPFSPSPLQQSTSAQELPAHLPAQASNDTSPVDGAPAAAATIAVAAAPVVEPPVDYVANLEDRVKEDPRGAVNAWIDLIREHRSQNRIDDARDVYERFFKTFPQAVSFLFTLHCGIAFK